jgi:hypothetical protein
MTQPVSPKPSAKADQSGPVVSPVAALDVCPNCKRCPLFPLFTNKSVMKFWVKTYCEANYSRCARYQSASKGVRPPDDMLPNGQTLPASALA